MEPRLRIIKIPTFFTTRFMLPIDKELSLPKQVQGYVLLKEKNNFYWNIITVYKAIRTPYFGCVLSLINWN